MLNFIKIGEVSEKNGNVRQQTFVVLHVHNELQTKTTTKGVSVKTLQRQCIRLSIQKTTMTSIEIIKTKQTSLGEAPHWCRTENVLYFLDILPCYGTLL